MKEVDKYRQLNELNKAFAMIEGIVAKNSDKHPDIRILQFNISDLKYQLKSIVLDEVE